MANFLDVFEDATKDGCKLPQEEYLPQGKYPIIDQGQKYIAGYTDREEGLYTDVPAILFGDHTRIIKYVDEPFFLGADGVKLLKAKSKDADYKYLYYALCSVKIPDTGYNRHFKWLKELDIPVPETREQQKIVQTLEKIDDLINIQKQQLSKLEELIKSRFVEMFGEKANKEWQTTIGDISNMVTVGIANSATHAYVSDGVVMLRNQNIKELQLDDSDLVKIAPEFAGKYKSKSLKEGDLLVTRTGYPGVACVVPKKYEGCQTFTTLIVRLINQEQTRPSYVCSYINSYYGKKYVANMSVGVAQQNFGAKALSKMPIYIPSATEQRQYETFVARSARTKFDIEQRLKKTETFKKTLIQKYFG